MRVIDGTTITAMNSPEIARRPLASGMVHRQAEITASLLRYAAGHVALGRPVDAELTRQFRAHREWGARDRRLLNKAVFGYFRWKGWIDRLAGDDWAARAALSLWFETTPEEERPAVADVLAEQGRLAPAWRRPLGGLALAARAEVLAAGGGICRPEWLVPEWLPAELVGTSGVVGAFIEAIQTRPPTWLRVRCGVESAVLDALRNLGIAAETDIRVAAAIRVPGSCDLNALRRCVGAAFEVQDIASQCVGLIAAPAAGERWWDACAASGGKSLHLADLARGALHILATDIREATRTELQRRVRAAGLTCIQVGLHDATQSPPAAGAFDGVLVDAPCSGIGTWSRNPDARWRLPADAVARLAVTQQAILRQAARAVRPGGRIVYAVCTLARRETDDVIGSFLAEHPDFALAVARHPLTGQSTTGSLAIWPQEGPGDGMFIANLRRCG